MGALDDFVSGELVQAYLHRHRLLRLVLRVTHHALLFHPLQFLGLFLSVALYHRSHREVVHIVAERFAVAALCHHEAVYQQSVGLALAVVEIHESQSRTHGAKAREHAQHICNLKLRHFGLIPEDAEHWREIARQYVLHGYETLFHSAPPIFIISCTVMSCR